MLYLGLFEGFKAWAISAILYFQTQTAVGLAATAISAMSFSNGSMVESKFLQVCFNWFNPIAFVLVAVYLTSGLIRTVMAGHELDTQMIVRFGVAIILADVLIANDQFLAGKILSLSNAVNNQISEALQTSTDMITAGVDAAGDAAEADNAVERKKQRIEDLKQQGYAGDILDKENSELESLESDAVKAHEKSLKENGAEGQMELDKMSLIQAVMYMLMTFIGFLLGQLAKVSLLTVCYVAKAEFLIRIAFSPIAFAGFADAEQRDPSLRYLRKLIASAFYCLSISLTIYAVTALQVPGVWRTTTINPENNSSAGFMAAAMYGLQLVVVPFAAVGAVATAKQIISEAFGG